MNIIYRMFIYDFLYIAGDQIIRKYNPCQVQPSSDGLVECASDIGSCCNGCEYLDDNGCMVNSVCCKLHVCATAEMHQPYIANKLYDMKKIASRYRLKSFRASRQDTYAYLRKIGGWREKLKDRLEKAIFKKAALGGWEHGNAEKRSAENNCERRSLQICYKTF